MINNVANQNALRVSTAVLNQVINEAIAIVQPPTDKGRRLKILESLKNAQNLSSEELSNLEDELSNIVIKLKK